MRNRSKSIKSLRIFFCSRSNWWGAPCCGACSSDWALPWNARQLISVAVENLNPDSLHQELCSPQELTSKRKAFKLSFKHRDYCTVSVSCGCNFEFLKHPESPGKLCWPDTYASVQKRARPSRQTWITGGHPPHFFAILCWTAQERKATLSSIVISRRETHWASCYQHVHTQIKLQSPQQKWFALGRKSCLLQLDYISKVKSSHAKSTSPIKPNGSWPTLSSSRI